MVTAPSVAVTVDDDDAPEVIIDEMSLDVREGGSARYNITLGVPPTGGNVVITISSDNSDVTVDPATVTITPTYSGFSPVKVSAAQDADSMDDTATLTHTVSGTSTNYTMVTAPPVAVSVDDDEGSSVVITPTTLTMDEGTTATYAVSLNTQPTENVTVDARSISASTARINISPNTLNFAPATYNIAQTVTVTATSDTDLSDGISTIRHTVTGLSGATTAPEVKVQVGDTGTGTPGVTVNTTRVVLDEGGSKEYYLQLTNRPSSAVTVTVSKTGDDDITVTPSTRTIDHSTWNFGDQIKFTVQSAQDADSTPDQATLSHTITGADYGSVTVPDVAVIVDDDEGTPNLHIFPENERERDDITFTVRLHPVATGQVTVNYATSDGTATAGTDYTTTSGMLTFSAGTTTQTITVSITDDTLDEDDETFTVTLSNPSGATLATASATGTIRDNDALPALDVYAASSAEDTGALTISFTLAGVSGRQATVDYATSDGTATAGTDYTATSGTITFAPGESRKRVQVLLTDDMTEEGEETFTITLSNPVNMYIPPMRDKVTARIIDPVDYIDIGMVAEGSNVLFIRPLTGLWGVDLTIHWTISPVTATAEDYGVTSGQSLYPAYARSVNYVIPIVDDNLPEGEETFDLVFTRYTSTIQSGSLTWPNRRVTIRASDPVGVSVSGDAIVNEGESATYTVNLSPAPTATLTVDYTTSDGTATAGTDYTETSGTLTFNTSETSKTITVQTTTDAADENKETFSFTLSNAMGGGGPAPTIGTPVTTAIIDNNDPPALRISDSSVTEGNSGSTNATFTVNLSAASAHQITVDLYHLGRYGNSGDRLHRDEWHAHIQHQRDEQDHHSAGDRRHKRRAERNVHGEAE